MPQPATQLTEQPTDDLIPRRVPTIVYRLPTASVQTVAAPTAPALSVRTVTPAATSRSNLVVLAGAAAAALCFAGALFHFTRRIHRSVLPHAVADGRGASEPVGGRSLADVIEFDLVEGVDQRDQQRNREHLPTSDETHDNTAVLLPHAATWLSEPKAKPRTVANYQLADA
jgi:hypothetical protein